MAVLLSAFVTALFVKHKMVGNLVPFVLMGSNSLVTIMSIGRSVNQINIFCNLGYHLINHTFVDVYLIPS